jgi:hypothetical protein
MIPLYSLVRPKVAPDQLWQVVAKDTAANLCQCPDGKGGWATQTFADEQLFTVLLRWVSCYQENGYTLCVLWEADDDPIRPTQQLGRWTVPDTVSVGRPEKIVVGPLESVVEQESDHWQPSKAVNPWSVLDKSVVQPTQPVSIP